MVEKKDAPVFAPEKKPAIKTRVSPRVIILTNEGDFPLVPHKNTGWFGLPGGRAEWSEMAKEANFFSPDAFPTLTREVKEECDWDISGFLEKSACLGLAEIWIVNSQAKQAILSLSPIFVYLAPTLGKLKRGVEIANLKLPLPGPIFPDARLAISRLKQGAKTDQELIQTELLNEKAIYFQLRPEVGQLMAPPPWLCTQ